MAYGYKPSNIPSDLPGSTFFGKELNRISDAIEMIIQGRIFSRSTEPPRGPDDGQLVFADGKSWDPGEGKGYYWWDEDSEEWRKLG